MWHAHSNEPTVCPDPNPEKAEQRSPTRTTRQASAVRMSWHWYHLNSRRSIHLVQTLGHHLQYLSNNSSRFLSWRGGRWDERTRLAALIDARYLHQRARSPDIAARAHDFHMSTVNVELRVDLIGEDMLEA